MKPPAFQFYADDFIGGVSDMTQAEVGAYILLLCHQWSRGEIPLDPQRAALIAKGEVTPHVMAKFPEGKNQRMETIRAERAAWVERQRDNGRKGMAKRWHNQAYNEPITTLQPNHNSPSPSPTPILDANTNKEGSGGHPSLCEVKAFAGMRGVKPEDAEQFWHHFESAGWIDKNGNPIVKWQSKLMTWKVNAASTMPAAGLSKPSGTSEAIIRQKELDAITKQIAAIKARDEHMDYTQEERAKLKSLRARQKELQQQLGWKI